jgi:hypothetical protein
MKRIAFMLIIILVATNKIFAQNAEAGKIFR